MYKHGLGFSNFQDVPYENGFIRATTKEKYIFVVKRQNQSKWVPKDKNGKIIHKTRPTMMWVPKTILAPHDVGTC